MIGRHGLATLTLLCVGVLFVSFVGRADAHRNTNLYDDVTDFVNEDTDPGEEDETEELHLEGRSASNLKECPYYQRRVIGRLPCSKDCGGGERQVTYDFPPQPDRKPNKWMIPCNNFPCDFKLAEGCVCIPADIIFVLDRSCSIGMYHWQQVVQFMEDFVVAQHKLIPDEHKERVRIGIVLFDWNVTLSYGLSYGLNLFNLEEVRETLVNLPYTPQYKRTETPMALTITDDEFIKHSASDTPELAIVLTDGKASSGHKLEPAIAKLNSNVDKRSVFAVGMGQYDKEEIMAIVNNDDERAFFADSFDELSNLLVKAVENVCCASNKMECTEMVETECSKTCGQGTKHVNGICEIQRLFGDRMAVINTIVVDEDKFCCLGDCPSTSQVVTTAMEPVDYCYPDNPCGEGVCTNTRCGYMCVMPEMGTSTETIPGQTCGE